MAHGPHLSPAFTVLDVLHPNQFESESFNPNLIEQTEKNFYRGAPPIWLNFHISEQASSGGTGIALIKRDGYETLVQQIKQRRERPGMPTVKLFHQPGCGGTTLAMQVLWDLRKTFRCAVLTGSTSDRIPYMLDYVLAREVVQLFTEDSSQKTVLLLLHDEQILENLQERIMEEIAAQKIILHMPVVVLLSCLRKDADLQSHHVVLKKALSDTEKQKFNDKKKELGKKYPDQYEQFHAFNIMQTNFSQAYVSQVCTVFRNVQRANKPPKTQLAAFLALLNAYVPGSYLLESQCLDFLKQKASPYESISLEDIVKPFSHLIITFTQNTSYEKRVHMAHPMIAQTCTELVAEAGVTRSDTTKNFLTYFCRAEDSPCLLGFIKTMLTKRETKKDESSAENKEKKENFSRLILDIQLEEGKKDSASVLKVASNKFSMNPFFPQALARFYYIVIKNYNLAEMWAKRAKERDTHNSFIADTLGQVHKNHLKSKLKEKEIPAKPREILQLARRAIEAFNDEEALAQKESETDMREDGNIKVSHVHNTRGQFGYLQVCDILYDYLVSHNETWREVLTGKVPVGSVLDLLGDNKLFRYYDLIKSLRDDVKDKCDFLNAFLTFSKPGMHKDDPPECKKTVESCYFKYVEAPVPDLVTEIKNKFKSYMEENVSLRDADPPELYIAAILKEWPTDNKNALNWMQLIKKASRSYDFAYAKYFRSRKLCPLFYLGKDEALGKIVPANIEHFLLENEDTTADFIHHMINKDQIFRDLTVQENLLRCYGKVKNYNIIASIGGADITLKANLQDSTWKQREVSFYLGFTIRGPVAFGIQTKPHENGSSRTCDSCHGVKDTPGWTAFTTKPTTKNGVTTYGVQSDAGRFQCTVSGLRWVCKKKVSFTYQFRSWEDHQQELDRVHCTPGGPLLEIRVTNGKFDEVYLPHWICVDGFPTVTDKFAVLHRKKFVNFLEQVSDVTSSHVKLFHPDFTTNGVLVRAGVSEKAHCNVLICQTNETFLTLRVHLIPCDPALQQELEQKERDSGSRIIRKMNTEKSLPMLEFFSLTSDAQTAETTPAQIQLSREGRTTVTVIIKKAKHDFVLTLQHAGECMWSCTITRDDYRK